MARAMEAAPSPPEAGYRGCHSPVTRLLPSLGCRAAALSGGAAPHSSRRRSSSGRSKPHTFPPQLLPSLKSQEGKEEGGRESVGGSFTGKPLP